MVSKIQLIVYRAWQTANGVKVTGTLNKETLEKMGIMLTDKQKAM